MNTIATFRKCTLSDIELIQKIDNACDEMYRSGRIPTRYIPAEPNRDFDLMLGELLLRFGSLSEHILGYCARCHKALLTTDKHNEIPDIDGVCCVGCE